MGQLSPRSIANFYTQAEIETKIAEYQSILDAAAQGGYSLDTTAGNQRVTPPDPDQVSKLLETWMKAYEIKTGTSRTKLYTADYRPTGGPN